MPLNRRQFTCLGAATIGSSLAASGVQASVPLANSDVATHVEAFRKAMVDGDAITLLTLADDGLSFGHSNGVVQTKQEFVGSIVSGTEIFRSIELTESSTHTDGEFANQRHLFTADILLKGKPLYVTLSVLEVWRRTGDGWSLIARQAFKT